MEITPIRVPDSARVFKVLTTSGPIRIATELSAYFELAIFSSSAPYRKPHPSIFNAAISRLNIKAENILFVGDDLKMDVLGPQSVGMPTAWLNRNRSALVENIVPHYQITSLSELLVIEPLEIAN